MATLDDLGETSNDAKEAMSFWGETLIEIAEMATDGRLDEAQCFLRARKLAQKALDRWQIEYTDNTFGGKTKT